MKSEVLIRAGFASAVLLSFGMALVGCSLESAEREDVSERREPLHIVGQDSNPAIGMSDTRPLTLATLFLQIPERDGGEGHCSGVRVGPDKILTAQHCFCEWDGWPVVYAGHLSTSVNYSPKRVCVDGDFRNFEDSPYDVAVVTMEPGALGDDIPIIRPFLGDPRLGLETGRLHLDSWVSGYGLPTWGDGFLVRRTARVDGVRLHSDPCDTPIEDECWPDMLFRARRMVSANAEIDHGDSGGGLFFNVDSNEEVYVAAVASQTFADSDYYQRWAPLGYSRDSLWDALELPPTFSLEDLRRTAAVASRETLRINDRAKVLSRGPYERNLVARGNVRLGSKSETRRTYSLGSVEVVDRAVAEKVIASGSIKPGQQLEVGQMLPAEALRFDDFDLNVPFPAGGTAPEYVDRGRKVTLRAGPQGNWTIRAGGEIYLSEPGVYVFSKLNLDGGQIYTNQRPVWVYTLDTGPQLKGAVDLGVGLFGAPRATTIYINDQFNATLVAPSAYVIADMKEGATLEGSFFARSFELHQGRYLYHTPFVDPATGNPLPWIPQCQPGSYSQCF